MAKAKKKKQQIKKKLLLLIIIALVIVGAVYLKVLNSQNTPERVSYNPVDLDMPNEIVLFSDDNNLYKSNLDGKSPKKIATVSRVITGLSILENGDILIHGTGEYMGDGNLEKGWTYESEGDKVYDNYWLLEKDSKEPRAISSEEYSKLQTKTYDEYITKETSSGGADIIRNKTNGESEVIGHISEKVDKVYYCDSNSGPVMYYPGFLSTYNGKLFLGDTVSGGGICDHTRHVYNDAGVPIYEFSNDLRSSVWISDYELLVSYRGDSKLYKIEFQEGVSPKKELLNPDFKDYLWNSSNLSPSKKKILLMGKEVYDSGLQGKIAVYDIDSNSIQIIDRSGLMVGWVGSDDIIQIINRDPENDTSQITLYDLQADKYYELANIKNSRNSRPIIQIY